MDERCAERPVKLVVAGDEGESVNSAGSAGDAPKALGSSTLRPGDATRSNASSLLSARIGIGRCVAEERLREVTKVLAKRGCSASMESSSDKSGCIVDDPGAKLMG